MKVTVIGTGYVGLVTGACLADVGNDVLCIDNDTGKVERLRRGEIPIHEPGLDTVVARCAKAGRLKFSFEYDEEHAGYYGTPVWVLMTLELWLARIPITIAPANILRAMRPN